MKLVQVINGKITQHSLPKTGILKDGSTVSGYHLLDEEVLLDEGWLPLEEYSQVSPIIIRGVEQSEDKDYYYSMIKDVVDNIVIWVANEEWEKAETAYLDLYYYLKERFEVV